MNLKKIYKTSVLLSCPAIITVVVLYFLNLIVLIKGPSMQPNLYSRDIVIVNRFDKSPQIGDLIVFRKEDGILVKRVLYTNGYYLPPLAMNDLYIYLSLDQKKELKSSSTTDFSKRKFCNIEGKYWVQGDNYAHSTNSDIYGPVSKDEMIGKVVMIVPMSRR